MHPDVNFFLLELGDNSEKSPGILSEMLKNAGVVLIIKINMLFSQQELR